MNKLNGYTKVLDLKLKKKKRKKPFDKVPIFTSVDLIKKMANTEITNSLGIS